jgi:hypothetical protein
VNDTSLWVMSISKLVIQDSEDFKIFLAPISLN